MQHID